MSLRDLPQAQRWPEFLDRRFTLKDDKVFSAVRWLTEVAAAEDAAKASADRLAFLGLDCDYVFSQFLVS